VSDDSHITLNLLRAKDGGNTTCLHKKECKGDHVNKGSHCDADKTRDV
jgi:hypothetical protein